MADIYLGLDFLEIFFFSQKYFIHIFFTLSFVMFYDSLLFKLFMDTTADHCNVIISSGMYRFFEKFFFWIHILPGLSVICLKDNLLVWFFYTA